MAQDNSDPPKKWWITPFARALHDFEWLASPNVEGPFFRNIDTIAGYAEQRRKLVRRSEVTAALSFIGASLVLAGGLPKNAKIGFFGVEGPASLISLQLLAAMVSVIFSQYIAQVSSIALFGSMIDKILTPVVPHGPEFVVARYDGTYLWANLLRQRKIGYQSPIGHKALNLGMIVAGLLWLILHMTVVGAAMGVALNSAYRTSGVSSFAFFITALATLNVAVAILVFFFSFLIPIPYPMSRDMAVQIERERSEKTKAATAATSVEVGSTSLGEVIVKSQSSPDAAGH